VALDPGSRVAKYRLDRRLGTGGMGEVFLAHDTHLDRPIAIKFLVSPGDDQARRRLLREARAVAGLDHPGICAIYEVGADPVGGDFIAMQYIEGETLAARLKRGRLKPDEALAVGARIADALAAAHHRGIVHRDLKPQNVMLTPAGLPKLLDFGLATHVAGTKAAAEAPTMSQVSRADFAVGTPGYMAPEQVRNEPADFKTDVFALGCVLYECLTGRRAFQGSTTAELVGQVLHVDPPAPSSLVTDLGPSYDALCARLLHKSPIERFQSAEEVLGAIRALTPSSQFPSGLTAVAVPPRPRVSRRLVIALVAGVVVVVAAWQLYQGRPLAPPSPEAAGWYDRGLERLRDGTYAGARKAFTEALNIAPRYPQAYYRLAEANTALEDEQGAQDALVKAGPLVKDRSRLTAEDQLRFDAASNAASRHYDDAIDAYRKLAELKPSDAGRWLDVGRAEEAAGRTAAARETYAKAIGLDGQYAAARLRFGILRARAGNPDEGLAAMEEAARLYKLANNTEGEAEALLRKAIAIGTNDAGVTGRLLDEVEQLSANDRYPSQHARAGFERARLAYAAGDFTEAENRARGAVAEAASAGLPTIAANGLIDLGTALLGLGRARYGDADQQYQKAIDLAKERGARRVAMRAQAQQAALYWQWDRPADAVRLAAEPFTYFSETNEARLRLGVMNVIARGHESLEHYEEASRLAADAVRASEAIKDNGRLGEALDNVGGQLTKLGRLPEALRYRERLVELHRSLKQEAALPRDLTNQAELLILLGRGADAALLLREVDAGIAAGKQPFVERKPRLEQLRALQAAIEERWADVARAAAAVESASPKPKPEAAATTKPSDTQLFARVLAEYGLAQQGRSRTPSSVVTSWPATASSAVARREWSYWVSRTLLARREAALAYQVAAAALAEAPARQNQELCWRLDAVTALAARLAPDAGDRAAAVARATTGLNALTAAWGTDPTASLYGSRLDFVVLKKDVR
jgi:tetratricopeptide (TPR) repeat protein